jgi:hypothetical protein
MQQLITGLLFVVQIPLNMFLASICPSSGAYQLQQQPLAPDDGQKDARNMLSGI